MSASKSKASLTAVVSAPKSFISSLAASKISQPAKQTASLTSAVSTFNSKAKRLTKLKSDVKSTPNDYKTGRSHVTAATSAAIVAAPKTTHLLKGEGSKVAAFEKKKPEKATFNISNLPTGMKAHQQKAGPARRIEVLQQLREKLRHSTSNIEKSTKTGKGAVQMNADGASAGSVKGGFNALSMSAIESHIQTFTLRFIDLIICCMVVDNYIYGLLILIASLAEITIGWLYIVQCTVKPILPYLLIANGVLNIIQVHMRNLANQRLIDYFVMSVFRLLALFSFLAVTITLLTIDPSMTIWSLPPDSIILSNSGLIYCSTVLYHFTYYFCIVGGALMLGLSAYGVGCIAYMVYSTGGRRIHDSRLSSSSASSKGTSGPRNSSGANIHASKATNKKAQK